MSSDSLTDVLKEIDRLVDADDFEGALALCEHANGTNSAELSLFSDRVRVLSLMRRFDEALSLVDHAEEFLGVARCSDYRSRIYFARGAYSRALSEVNKALDGPGAPSSLYLLRARIYQALLDYTSAANDFATAIKANPKSTSRKLAYASFAMDYLRDFTLARQLVGEVVEHAPNLDDAKLALLKLDSLENPSETSLSEYEDAITNESRSTALLHDFGQYAQTLGFYSRALRVFERLIALNPKETDYRYHAAACGLDLHNPLLAKRYAREALELDEASSHARAVLGIAQCELREPTEGLANLERAALEKPSSSFIWSRWMQLLVEHGESDRAIQVAHQFIENNPASRDGMTFLARVLIDSGRSEEALEILDKINPDEQNDLNHLAARAAALSKLRKTDESIDIYETLCRKRPTVSDYRILLGHALQYRRRDIDGALREYQHALSLNPSDVHAIMHIADIMYKREQFNDTLDAIELVLTKDSEYHGTASLAKALTLRELGRTDEAIRAARSAARETHNGADAQLLLGSLYLDIEEYERALSAYQRVTRADPRNTTAVKNSAYCKAKLNDLEGAIKGYTEAIELDGRDSVAYANRAALRLFVGDSSGAAKDSKRAAALNKELDAVGLILIRSLLADGNASEARAEISKELARNPQSAEGWWLSAACQIAVADDTHSAESYLDAIEDLNTSLRLLKAEERHVGRDASEAQLLIERAYSYGMLQQLSRAKRDYEKCARLSVSDPVLSQAAAAGIRRINRQYEATLTAPRWIPPIISVIVLGFITISTVALWKKILPPTSYTTILLFGLAIVPLTFLLPVIGRLKVAGVELERFNAGTSTTLHLERASIKPFSEIALMKLDETAARFDFLSLH